MQVQNERFYVVETPSESHVLPTETDAISHLKEHGGEIDPESDDVNVVEVQFGGSDWTIKELPWQQIALQLLQE